MLDILTEFHHGPASVLEWFSTPFPRLLSDRFLSRHIGAEKNSFPSAQSKDRDLAKCPQVEICLNTVLGAATLY